MSTGVVTELPQLLSEAEAYERFQLLEDKELRRARAAREIGFYRRKNRIWYRLDELERFIANRLIKDYTPPCPHPSPDSAGIGSAALPDRRDSMPSGMTPELERSGAERYVQQILKRPNSTYRRSFIPKDPESPKNQSQSG
jgi:hypothetical protein